MRRRRIVQTGSLVSAIASAGCGIGFIDAPAKPVGASETGENGSQTGVAGDVEGVTKFTCDDAVHVTTPALPRLSRVQYQNALRDVLTVSVGRELASNVLTRVDTTLRAIPNDTVTQEAAFSRMDDAVTQQHVDTQLAVAERIAAELTSTSEGMAALLDGCATASEPAAADQCVDEFILRFGRVAHRGVLTSSELAFYREVYAAKGKIDARALGDVIAVMLSAPEFLYVVEGRGRPQSEPGVVSLTPYEKAARLALHFWQTLPDEGLLAAAEQGGLDDAESVRSVVADMLEDPRSEATLDAFVREWFRFDALRPLDSLSGDPVYDAFVGADIPTPELREDMISELTASLSYHAFRADDGIAAWITSPFSFARSQELADIYGTPIWDGTGEPPRFPEGERAGLFTRAALLATGTANTRPIMKGVFLRRAILCDTIAPPPNNAANMPPALSPEQTTREVVEALTESEGSGCAGCHATQINGLGFPSEGFDALGRVRTNQRLFDAEGKVLVERAVDTETIPRVWIRDERPVHDMQDLTARMLESGKIEACFARQYVRFALGREENAKDDGCALESVRASLSEGKPLSAAFAAIALSPTFLERYVPEEP